MKLIGRIVVAVVLLGLVFLIKDGRVPGLIEQLTGQVSAAGVSGAAAPSSADKAMSDKLQPFITCINRVDTNLREHFKEYDEAWPKRLARENAGLIFGFKIEVYETDNSMSKECATSIEQAIAQPPADKTLDATGKVYAATLRELIPLMNAVDAYYDQEDFRDDDMAKGRELDAQIRPLFATLFTASDKFRARVAEHDLQLTENQLAAIEAADGKTFPWHELNLMHQARQAIDAVEAVANGDTLSVASIEPIEQKFAAAIEAGNAYAAANPKATDHLGNPPKWFKIVSYGNDFLTAIKTLRRDLAENADTIEYDFNRVFDGYNSLVDDYNLRVNMGL